jgi:alpha-galactosidase
MGTNEGTALDGTDITQLSEANIDILQNKHLIAFNQDPIYGKPATPYKWGVNPNWTYNSTNPAEFWSGQSSQGIMVAMFNSLNTTRTMTADFSEIPRLTETSYRVIDAWTGRNMGCKKGSIKTTLNAHDTAVLLLQNTCASVSDVAEE